MKYFITAIILISMSIPCKSTTISLDSIKYSLVKFLKEIDHISEYKPLPDFFIIDRKKGEIKEGKEGIFSFKSTLSSGTRKHFVLVDKDSFSDNKHGRSD